MRRSFIQRFKSQVLWIGIPVACWILYTDRGEEFELGLRLARPIVSSLVLCVLAASLDFSIDKGSPKDEK